MTIAEKITRAKEDYAAVHAAGKQAEYDEFWDEYQKGGRPKQYFYAFAGYGWNDATFKPKHDILFSAQSNINAFQYCLVTDLSKSLRECGVCLDTSAATALNGLFAYAKTKTLPVIDITNANISSGSIFNSCRNLESVEKFVVAKINSFSKSFENCESLKDIIFEGEIANDLDISWSTLLSKESIQSIANALSDTAEGKTLTLSKTAVENAFPSEEAIEFYPDNETATDNGYTFTVNDNGSITINGTGDKSELADGRFGYNISLPLPKGIYEFSLPSDTDSDNLYAYYGVYAPTDPLADVFVFPNNTQTVAIEDDEACAWLSLIVSGGSTVDNITVKPTIKRIVAWDELAATKPNWTISLV